MKHDARAKTRGVQEVLVCTAYVCVSAVLRAPCGNGEYGPCYAKRPKIDTRGGVGAVLWADSTASTVAINLVTCQP